MLGDKKNVHARCQIISFFILASMQMRWIKANPFSQKWRCHSFHLKCNHWIQTYGGCLLGPWEHANGQMVHASPLSLNPHKQECCKSPSWKVNQHVTEICCLEQGLHLRNQRLHNKYSRKMALN
jgi:hypothetical protein